MEQCQNTVWTPSVFQIPSFQTLLETQVYTTRDTLTPQPFQDSITPPHRLPSLTTVSDRTTPITVTYVIHILQILEVSRNVLRDVSNICKTRFEDTMEHTIFFTWFRNRVSSRFVVNDRRYTDTMKTCFPVNNRISVLQSLIDFCGQ
jgi:hypothetical protein